MNGAEGMGGAAWDMHALDTLKYQAGSRSPQALRAAAVQMEGIFMQMMLKSMRDAGVKDGLLSSQASQMYTSMLDQQLALEMAQKSPLGFADLIVSQAGGQAAVPAGRSATAVIAPLPPAGNAPAGSPAAVMKPRAAVPSRPGPQASEGLPPFIRRLLRPALLAAQRSGIHPHLLLAQAALESGWGERQILNADGTPSHNLFGIKAGADWQGKTTRITTTEVVDGQARKVNAAFRAYDSLTDALSDYTRLLQSSPRYRHVLRSSSAEQGARALQEGGYATDPAYASKLIHIIRQLQNEHQHGIRAYQTDLSAIF